LKRYKKCLPSGRKTGEKGLLLLASTLLTGVHVPPVASTRSRGPWDVKRITPSRFQAPGPPPPIPVSHKTWTAPPLAGMVLSFPSAKNPMERLSGDQKGSVALSVPDKG